MLLVYIFIFFFHCRLVIKSGKQNQKCTGTRRTNTDVYLNIPNRFRRYPFVFNAIEIHRNLYTPEQDHVQQINFAEAASNPSGIIIPHRNSISVLLLLIVIIIIIRHNTRYRRPTFDCAHVLLLK